tara:strand:+ start:89 stop:484 length:396 start_codon:yes stop_codon:yes gene_type:complete
LVGCETGLEPTSESEYYLNISAPSLVTDSNGYYHIEWDDDLQTFTTLRADTGSPDTYQKLGWMSDTEVKVSNTWTNCVNGNSYTDDTGTAYTVLSVWGILVGDTITVIAGYHDEFSNHHLDSLKVVVDNEI